MTNTDLLPAIEVKVRRDYADPAFNGYYSWRYEGITAFRALELAADSCAAQCVDYISLEATVLA